MSIIGTGPSDFYRMTVSVIKLYFKKQGTRIIHYRDYKTFNIFVKTSLLICKKKEVLKKDQLRDKTPSNQPMKSREITAFTFSKMKRKISLKIWKLRISLTIRNFRKQLSLFLQIQIQMVVIK